MTPDEMREQRELEVQDAGTTIWKRWLVNQAWRMRIAPTKAENAMADILTEASLSYVPQAVCGRFIADFLLTGTGLVIEVDGSSHRRKGDHDERRTWKLNQEGFSVIRFTNDEVLESPRWVLLMVEQTVRDIRRMA